MRKRGLLIGVAAGIAVAVAAVAGFLLTPPDVPARDFTGMTGDAGRGAYVARLAGCIACHTGATKGGGFLAGGARIKTPFGGFFPPNVTPHPADGIGGWDLADFARALTAGERRSGVPLYPAFPYYSYTRMTSQDIIDLWTAMKTVKPSAGRAPDHELGFPFDRRILLNVWRRLFLDPGPLAPDRTKSRLWNRGRYIVTGPGHCGACHTPRNLLGGPDRARPLAGTASGPGGRKVPAITRAALKQRGWTESGVAWALRSGLTPTGDTFGGAMGEVVRDGTSFLGDVDLRAIATYLLSDGSGAAAATSPQLGSGR